MKIYKYQIKTDYTKPKINEYLVECNLKEIDFYLDENIVFSFNDDGEIEQLEDDDHFLEVVRTNSIQTELIEIPKETLNNIWNIYLEKYTLKDELFDNEKRFKEIIAGLKND